MTIGSLVGARVKRKEDPRLIQGKATYVDDVQLPGMMFAQFVRTPYALANIRQINKEGALQAGCQVFTWADFKDALNFNPLIKKLPNRPFLANGEVRMVGEMVALVV